MIEKLISNPLQKAITLYIFLIIGNETTEIINDSIDTVIGQVDGTVVFVLNVLRLLVNFEGAAIVAVICFIIWYLSQLNN